MRPLPQNPDGRAFVECTLNVAMMSLFVCALSATEPLCKRICRVYSKRCYDEAPCAPSLPQNLCESAFVECTLNGAMMSLFVCALSATEPL